MHILNGFCYRRIGHLYLTTAALRVADRGEGAGMFEQIGEKGPE